MYVDLLRSDNKELTPRERRRVRNSFVISEVGTGIEREGAVASRTGAVTVSAAGVTVTTLYMLSV